MRLMEVRIPWEPSSFLEDNDRKNVYFELRDPMVRAYLQRHEESLGAAGWGGGQFLLGKRRTDQMQNQHEKRARLRQRQAHNRNAAQVGRACLQRAGKTHRQVANTRRFGHGLKPAGDRRAGAPRQ